MVEKLKDKSGSEVEVSKIVARLDEAVRHHENQAEIQHGFAESTRADAAKETDVVTRQNVKWQARMYQQRADDHGFFASELRHLRDIANGDEA